MSRKEKSLPRKNSDLFGFNYEQTQDTRNIHHKGKHSYKDNEKMRIYYIKEKKERQKSEQQSDNLNKFNKIINMKSK